MQLLALGSLEKWSSRPHPRAVVVISCLRVAFRGGRQGLAVLDGDDRDGPYRLRSIELLKVDSARRGSESKTSV